MSDEPRGPTTEELRARVLAHESRERAEAEQDARLAAMSLIRPGHLAPETFPLEGRTFYDPARPPLDSEGAERP